MIKPYVVPQDSIGRACCAYCRTEFDARRPQGCPICAVTGHSRCQSAKASSETPKRGTDS